MPLHLVSELLCQCLIIVVSESAIVTFSTSMRECLVTCCCGLLSNGHTLLLQLLSLEPIITHQRQARRNLLTTQHFFPRSVLLLSRPKDAYMQLLDWIFIVQDLKAKHIVCKKK